MANSCAIDEAQKAERKKQKAERKAREAVDLTEAPEDDDARQKRKEERKAKKLAAAELDADASKVSEDEEARRKRKEERRAMKAAAESELKEDVPQVSEDEEARKRRKEERRAMRVAAVELGADAPKASEDEEARRKRKEERRAMKAASAEMENEAPPALEDEEARRKRKEERRAMKAAATEVETDAPALDDEARRKRKEERKAMKAAASEQEASVPTAAEDEETRKKRKEERRALKAAELAGDGLRTSEVVDGQKKRKTECQELDEAQAGSLEKKDSQHVKAVQHSGSTPAKRIKAERTKASAATLAGFADVRVSGAGSDAFSPWSRFDELLFPNAPASVYVMEQMGFVSPTVIQAYCWPIACTKRDLIGIAKTGSGKTLAYMLPAFPIIMDAHAAVDTSSGFYKPKPLIAVIAPTRELAVQIEQESNRFQSICGVRTVCVYGGASKTEQIAALSKGADIVVATPGRLNDFLSKPDKYTGKTILSLSSVSYVVLDEADRMLDMGFEPQIRQILSYVSSERQTLLFSATWPEEVRQLATEFISNPIHVVVGACDHFQANGDVEQNVVLVESDATGAAERAAKKRELRRILQDNAAEMCIVFCGMKKTAGVLADELWADGFSATGLHGDMPQWQRDQAMKSFIDGQVKVLVATDVAARGLDVQGITVVVNYDPAEQVDDHVHRTGRTGRAGKKGRAYTILGKGEIRQAKLVAEVIRKAGQVVPDELQALERLPTGNWKTRKSAEWRNRARKNA